MKLPLQNKTILFGVTGGISAYKAPEIIRLLKKAGASVQVLMTHSAEKFVTPTTLGTVSENEVLTDVFPKNMEGSWTKHIHLASSADAFVIAPATANTIAKLASGLADNMLTNVYLSLSPKTPVIISPAMDTDMYIHPSTQENISKLKKRGNIIIPPADGLLASGLSGIGRLPEPADVYSEIVKIIGNENQTLKGKTVLISAGPTREAIDPVRYISNHSSGKMGYSIAEAALVKGATVHLVSGPTHQQASGGIRVYQVQSAVEMRDKMVEFYDKADFVFMAAAVADFRVDKVAKTKIKKHDSEEYHLDLVKNPDILKELGSKKKNQVLIGFALETDHELENAKKKLKSKNLDAIVLNNPLTEGAGFDVDTNVIRVIKANDEIVKFDLKLKRDLAFDLIEIAQEMKK